MVRGDLLRKAVISEAVHGRKGEELPEGWEWVKLGDITSNHGQKIPDREFTYIEIGSVDNKYNRLGETHILTPDKAPASARKIVHVGDVLYGKVRTYLHNVCIIEEEFTPEPIASSAFAVMTTGNLISNRYLYYYLLTPAFDVHADYWCHGSVYPSINDKNLMKLPIAWPPIDEQRRIVARLDPLVRELTELEEHLTKFRAARERFRKAAIQDATHTREGEELPAGWRWVRLGEIGRIIGGGTPNTKRPEYWADGSISWITPLDMSKQRTQMYISHGERNITPEGFAKSSAQLLPKGSVIMSSRAPIGYLAIAANELCTSQGCRSIVPYDCVVSEYLYYALTAKRRDIVNMGRGTTFAEIPGKLLATVTIPLPPIDQQRRIVNYLDNLSHQINHMDL